MKRERRERQEKRKMGKERINEDRNKREGKKYL